MNKKNSKIDEDKRKKMEEWFDDYFAKQEKDEKRIKEMMHSTKYINWLFHFTFDKDMFFDNDLKDYLSDEDNKNVAGLKFFYTGIKRYASENYLYPTGDCFGDFYKIKLNKFKFVVGFLVHGSTYFFKKVIEEDEEGFINFKDVMLDIKQSNCDQIKSTLDSISNMIISAYESGVPVKAIDDRCSTTIDIINDIEKQKPNIFEKRK